MLTDDLTTSKNDFNAIPHVLEQDSINYSRPKNPMFGSTVPIDNASIDDSFNFIEQVQKSLKNGIAGVSYSGPIDGSVNSELLSAITKLEQNLEIKFSGEKFLGTIRFGTMISNSGWNRAMKLLSSKKEEIKEKDKSLKDSKIIEFQKFFGLPQTGEIDSALISAAKQTEQKMIDLLKEPAIRGMLWNDTEKKFNTSLDDLQTALSIIEKYKK